MANFFSILLNLLLIAGFIIDRIFRLRSVKEYREAKDAQLNALKLQLDIERSNNDIQIANLHKQRYENLKILLDEKDRELDDSRGSLLLLQEALQKNMEKGNLLDMLLKELDRVERARLSTGLKRRLFLQQLKS